MPLLRPVPEALPSPAPRPGPAIDLQRLLIPDPARTVLLRVGGDSMVGAGIHHGDLVVVERHQAPRDGQLVVARLADGFTLKRLVLRGERRLLVAAHPAYPTLTLGEGELWGVVTHAIRSLSA
jgi:DNA polymerase V